VDDVTGEVISVGAEAEVRADEWLGRAAVAKQRLPKRYRDARLDERLRRERIRTEAAVMALARQAGVAVPFVYDVDVASATLRIERVVGPTLRQALAQDEDGAPALLEAWGAAAGRLHAAGLVHGDLTTSNVIVRDGVPVLLDFGLSARSQDVEDHGTDLVLVERTLESTHPSRAAQWFGAFLEGYARTMPDADRVEARRREIRGRARYV
jgi:Kae1-associated kinase Bud32